MVKIQTGLQKIRDRLLRAKLSSSDHNHDCGALREYCEHELIYAYDNMVPSLLACVERLVEGLEKLKEYYGHRSGCGTIFGWPFSNELIDGCSCGVAQLFEFKTITESLSDASAILTGESEKRGGG